MLNIVLFGPPGAGKGTQAAKLIEKYNLSHLSTGDILRGEIAGNTKLGIEAKGYMEKGELVPDKLVIDMIAARIKKESSVKGFIFDGFPRTTAQAKALDELLNNNGTPINVMITLDVENEELVKRLLLRGKDSGREDDKDENIIRNRIKVYESETAPVKDFYNTFGKYKPVDGIGKVDDIFNSLCSIIDSIK